MSGHVRIFEWNGTDSSWNQLGQDLDGEKEMDMFGASLSLSLDGTRVAVGSVNHNGGRGQVKIYEYSNTIWNQLGSTINGENATDRTGWAVSLSNDGSRVSIATPNASGGGYKAGSVIIYDWNETDTSWNQVSNEIFGEHVNDQVGKDGAISLSSDGNRVAIGSVSNDDGGNNAGHVRIFELT